VSKVMSNRSSVALWGLVVASAFACGCDRQNSNVVASEQTDSAPKYLMIHYGCPTCHVIPGVPGAVGTVGPMT
jgi:hypothetical protein